MTFCDDFNNFFKRKTEEKRPVLIPGARKLWGVGKPCKMAKSKPNLIDPNAKDGPVKQYTPEEIKEYEAELRRKGLL